MLNKKTIKDIDIKNKKVLMRCDFNVPQKEGKISDDTRIKAALPSIQYLLDNNCAVILCSHLGRPKNGPDPAFSLEPVAVRLSELLNKEVIMAKDVVGNDAAEKAKSLKNGQVLLLENVRFEKGETKNDVELSKKFASMAEVYVNDAFGSAHRAHSSTAGVADYLPAVSGFLMEKELEFLGTTLDNPARPFTAILGGAKVSDKIGVIENLIDKADNILIGGGMCYTFFKAMGLNIGKSLCEEDNIETAKRLMEKAKSVGKTLTLPLDTVIADEFAETANVKTVKTDSMPEGWLGTDIGPETVKQFSDIISESKTIFWNGPMGVFEMKPFAEGTKAVAKAMAENTSCMSVVGGGDSASAVKKLGFGDKMSHISTGGGASLEFIEGKLLPGVVCLNDK